MSPSHLERHRAARNASKDSASRSGAELRELLIDAADRLLADRQVSAITTRDIARAAGLSDGVLYNYFANKNDLVVVALLAGTWGFRLARNSGITPGMCWST